jgi:hypothetical protein
MITSIEKSPKQHKRFRVYMDNGKHYDFGLDTGQTYIDHGDKDKRFAYWSRHIKNHTEQRLIDNLVPSPALFSATLLWGHSTSLDKNIKYLNKQWKIKHKVEKY